MTAGGERLSGRLAEFSKATANRRRRYAYAAANYYSDGVRGRSHRDLDVFDARATHPWPGEHFALATTWREPYAALAAAVGGGVTADFEAAVREAESFLARIDATR